MFGGAMGIAGFVYGAMIVTKDSNDDNPDSNQALAVLPELKKRTNVKIARKVMTYALPFSNV